MKIITKPKQYIDWFRLVAAIYIFVAANGSYFLEKDGNVLIALVLLIIAMVVLFLSYRSILAPKYKQEVTQGEGRLLATLDLSDRVTVMSQITQFERNVKDIMEKK